MWTILSNKSWKINLVKSPQYKNHFSTSKSEHLNFFLSCVVKVKSFCRPRLLFSKIIYWVIEEVSVKVPKTFKFNIVTQISYNLPLSPTWRNKNKTTFSNIQICYVPFAKLNIYTDWLDTFLLFLFLIWGVRCDVNVYIFYSFYNWIGS